MIGSEVTDNEKNCKKTNSVNRNFFIIASEDIFIQNQRNISKFLIKIFSILDTLDQDNSLKVRGDEIVARFSTRNPKLDVLFSNALRLADEEKIKDEYAKFNFKRWHSLVPYE